eukprot:TRINITY_DN25573_c0_g1_i1.p1 TRINITY_DN25573_c0_g1~~TRINITY_DN25573_c0_g1_i1.p1  ORF type:complete len:101 (+),score=7.79 TRINITY_DN25573_c0_g1_i1:157-459(+)
MKWIGTRVVAPLHEDLLSVTTILKKRRKWLSSRNNLQNLFALLIEVIAVYRATSGNQVVIAGIVGFLILIDILVLPTILLLLTIPFKRIEVLLGYDGFHL